MVSRSRHLVPIAVVLMLAAGCSTPEDPAGVAGAEPVEEVATTAPTTEAPCRPRYEPLPTARAPEPTPAGLLMLSESVYSCVDQAILVDFPASAAVAREAAAAAAGVEGPLLAFAGPADLGPLSAELERLGVDEVITVEPSAELTAALGQLAADLQIGSTVMTAPTVTTSGSTGPTTTAPATVDEPAESSAVSPSPPDTTDPVPPDQTTAGSAEPGSTSTEPTGSPTTAAPTPTTSAPTTVVTYAAPAGLAAAGDDGPVVVVGLDDPVAAYLLAPAVAAGGGEVIAADLADTDALRSRIAGRAAVPTGGATPTVQWQVALAASDTELFGGGTRVFPDRRIVAYYGNPMTFRLGLLGETDPERAVERVTERAALYQGDGLPPAQPGFEIIATVASTSAGDDGNYSNEMDLEVLRPWIEAALANDVMVILDLQPGRTDFLTQAQLYEEFLRLPNVGLALDPEWRLEPDQRHLRQIGRVTAEEINSVVHYLAELVRQETLPPKILILHQFKSQMLPDRELIRTPPELAVVVHVDGQGSLGSKYGTWAAMLDAPVGPDQQLWWAWKNFIDEDFPTATPGQVNAVEPLPVIVTYQ